MNSRLYVGNLSESTDVSRLREAFTSFGEILALRIVSDAETGQSRGFGFIEYPSNEEAERAWKALNGSELDGRTLNVKLARSVSEDGFRAGAPSTKSRRGGTRGNKKKSPQAQ